ncbi:hypothetical protein SKAU_G00243400 [Synaphobranchus kaupii]|uniref:Uncharacterized protein n=1 Tax=Synaphobranchus kaupii TaxID=118154 RepID=A0A9Q1F7Y8_SYNKA|nr:hypothetical protein SKAU_G00243400 [Synaphobranchus kaupii]
MDWQSATASTSLPDNVTSGRNWLNYRHTDLSIPQPGGVCPLPAWSRPPRSPTGGERNIAKRSRIVSRIIGHLLKQSEEAPSPVPQDTDPNPQR